MEFTAVKEIEDLHHDESVEDEGEVTGVDVEVVVAGGVVGGTVDEDEATGSSEYAVVFAVEFVWVEEIELVGEFGEELIGEEGDDHHDDELVDGLADDVFEHFLGDDVLVSFVGLTFEEFFGWRFGGEGKGGKGIHDQVDP